MKRTFSVAQANALVPWLTEQFGHTRRLAKELRSLRAGLQERVQPRAPGSAPRARPVPADERMAEQIGALESEIRSRIAEATAFGIEVRRIDGLCDFPAWIDGQVGFLCWRYGEPRIAFWHPSTAGFDGRRPLPDAEDAHAEVN